MPYFSILIPSYNRPEELRRCIASVLSNSFTDYEIIISDDNSPKSTEIAEAVLSFGQRENIKFYSQKENLREPRNKNFLVEVASGKFNIIIGDDDTLSDNALSLIFNFIEDNPGHDIYGLGYTIVDEYGEPLTVHKAPHGIILNTTQCQKLILEAGTLPMTIFHPATFCCRSGLESDFPYRTDIGIGEDLCFIFEIVLAEKSICIIPKSLFNWRKVQNIDSIEQGNQSAEYLASFESKLLIYDVIANTGRMSSDIGDYINSRYFRERFLYREILRDGNFDDLSRKQVTIGDDKIEEIRNLNMSIVWRLKLKLIRLQRIYELIGLFGFIGALRMIVYFVFFAGAHYFVPFSLKKRLLND